MKIEEYTHQALCNYLKDHYPDVIFTTDLSGVRLTMKLAKQVKTLKACRGIPDLIIFCAAGGFHGLLLEIKADDVTIYTKAGQLVADQHIREQAEVITRLRRNGYAAFFVQGIRAGQTCIKKYMQGMLSEDDFKRTDFIMKDSITSDPALLIFKKKGLI